MAKCLICNSCLDVVWVGNKRYLHCWLDDKYYDVALGATKIYEVPKDKVFPDVKTEEVVIATIPEVDIIIQPLPNFNGEIKIIGIPVDVGEVKIIPLSEEEETDVPIVDKKRRRW